MWITLVVAIVSFSVILFFFFFSSRRRHTRSTRDWSSDVCSSDLGYDVHRFAENRALILGGVEIPHTHGLDGHSDADVLVHAIADAVLGAIGERDRSEERRVGKECRCRRWPKA